MADPRQERSEELPVSEDVRRAIDRHIAERRADPEFQVRLKRRLEEDAPVLALLEAKGD